MTNFTRVFSDPGDFRAYDAAVSFLRARRFSVGPMQGPDPVGILFHPRTKIAKWRSLTDEERAALHGTITGAKRAGPVTVTIFASAPEAARAAVSHSQAA